VVHGVESKLVQKLLGHQVGPLFVKGADAALGGLPGMPKGQFRIALEPGGANPLPLGVQIQQVGFGGKIAGGCNGCGDLSQRCFK